MIHPYILSFVAYMYLLKQSQGLVLNRLADFRMHNFIFCNITFMKMINEVCYIKTSFISLYTSETIDSPAID